MMDGLPASPPPAARGARARSPRLPVLGLLGLAALKAQADADPGSSPRTFAFTPSVVVSETATDNANLTSTNRRSDLISELSPTLHVRSTAGAVTGYFDYALNAVDYARHSGSNTLEQQLSSAVSAQLFDGRAGIDADAAISRQNISALGPQTPNPAIRTGNQTQVATLDVNPFVRGKLGSFAMWRLGAGYGTTRTRSDAIGDSSHKNETLHVGSDQDVARVNWALDASQNDTDFSVGRYTRSRSAVGSLIWNPTPELQLTARGGRESNDIRTLQMRSNPTYGGGLRWTPSERTTLLLQDDHQYFGNAYTASFQTRTAQTVWTIAGTRNVTSDASAASQGALLSAFDLVYLQLASKFPDPIQRAQQALIELQTLGINPLATVPSGFLTNGVSVQRNLSFNFAYLGARTTLMLAAQQGDTSRLDPLSTANDSISDGNPIRIRSASLALSRTLTPQSSANFSLGESRTLDLVTGRRVDLRSFTANWSARLGVRTQMSLGARRSVSTGDSPYTEWALLASFNLQL